MTILIFALLVAFLVIDFKLDKKFYSPVKIFNLSWLIVFGLYQLKLSSLQTDFTPTALIVFITCIASFNGAYYLAKYIKERKRRKKRADNAEIFRWYKPSISVTKRLTIVNIVFLLLFIVEIIYNGGLPIFSLLTGGDSNYLNFGIPSLNGFMYGVAICMGAYYIYKKDVRALIYIGFGISIISRQLVISMVIEAIIVFVCKREKTKAKIKLLPLKVIAVVVVAVVGFGIVGNLRSGSNTMHNIFQPRDGYENLPSFVMWPYSYMEFSFSNFNNLTTKTDGAVNYGSSSLNAILPTVVTNKINIKRNFNEYYLIRPNFTVSTWFPEIYLDFGIIGILVFSALLALLSCMLYGNMQRKDSIENALLYALLIHNIVLFFFVNMFLYLPVISQIILIPLFFREGKNRELSTKNN